MSRISLDGIWDFQVSAKENIAMPQAQGWRLAVVPMPWQAQFEDLRNTGGTAWYRRHFVIDHATFRRAAESAAILHFGAVNYHTTVWLNARPVGVHEGGYLPFEFDIIDLLREVDNELLVKVVDATDDLHCLADFPFSEIPHGKQSWYGPIGGIWQSVWLEFRPKLHITELMLKPSPAEAGIHVQATLSGPAQNDVQVVCTVTGRDGQTASSGNLDYTFEGMVRLGKAPLLWSPDAPNLYTVTATLHVNGNPTHSVQKTCGFRTIEARNGRIHLNGAPVYLRGILDQGYYPDTIYTPSSLNLLEQQAQIAKTLGFNCVRIHIKVEDPRYYDVADRLGLLVWSEIPNHEFLTDASSERAKQTFRSMVERDNHHPSIIAWTLINENWGTDLSRNPEHRRWLADFYHEAKKIDPTRLIVDNSACSGNAHVASDLEDFHNYRAIPDHADEWNGWVAEFAKRGKEVWYPDYANERRSDLPLLVSEFGNWGLPDLEEIQEKVAEPWWFETGFEWEGAIVYPHGVMGRFVASGLADLFPSYADFARHSQEHMARSLQYEINIIRQHDSIAGYIVTEFTDVLWESNGVLTMQRKPKYGVDPLLKNINQERVVLLRPSQWSSHPGGKVEVVVQTKDVSGLAARGVISWQAGEQMGDLPAPGGSISVKLDVPGVVTLSATWLGEAGEVLAVNQVNLVCAAAAPASAKLRVVGNEVLAKVLCNLGYCVSEGQWETDGANDEIVVAESYTHALEAHIQKGGRVLLLVETDSAEKPGVMGANVPLPIGYIVPRIGTAWQGDWATSIAWIKKQGPLAHLPGGPLLEMEWARVMPDAIIAGLPSWFQHSYSWAGLAVGWIHKSVSLLAVIPYGRGQILVTTFKLNTDTLATDAMAQALFAGLVNLL